MDPRYIVTIQRAAEHSPESLATADQGQVVIDLGEHCVTLLTMAGPDDGRLTIERNADGSRLTITEGCIVQAGGSGPNQSGSYNQLIVDAARGEVRLHNDTLGVLPLYFSTSSGALRVSNSLRILRREAGLTTDELGIAETFLFGGWAIDERTILKGGRRVAAGTEYRFKLGEDGEPQATRLSENWTKLIDESVPAIINQFVSLWNNALRLHFENLDSTIGIFLSGGLDSRLVAGGLAALGKQVVGITHGDAHSEEVRIAGEVAATIGATWISNAIDDTFSFERLALDWVNQITEALVNPMWDSSGQYLAAAGATYFTTGAGFDLLFGGPVDANKRLRLMKNIRNSTLGARKLPPISAEALASLADTFAAQARKRARIFSFLLAEPYRALIIDSLPAVHQEVTSRIADTAQTTPTLPQLYERFMCDHRVRQFTTMQERQLLPQGQLLLPTYDRDLLAYITNLPPELKYDHYLYYRAFRRLYPDLAPIQVTNLGTSINKPQILIELTRALAILRKNRLRSWVNFEGWVRTGGRLEALERRFLDASHFFDPDGVRTYFNDVRAGTRRIYDGNEILGFLSLSMLLDESR